MLRKHRTILIMIIAAALLVSICGCTPKASETVAPTENTTPAPTDEEPTTPPEATNEPEASETPAPTPTPKPLVIPEVTLETKELEPIVQPEPGENGLVRIDFVANLNTCRSVEMWVDQNKPQNIFGDGRMYLFDCKPITVIFATTVPIKVSNYSFVTDITDDPDGNDRPSSWKLYGANTISYNDQVLLDERTNVELPLASGEESELFEISEPSYYNYYKIVFEESAGKTDDFRLSNLYLYGKDGDCIGDYEKFNSSLDGYTILNGAINMRLLLADPFPQTENPLTNLFDCDIETRTWVNCQYAQDSEYVDFFFAFKQKVQIDAYRYTLSDPWGCPAKWELYGTDDKKMTPENMYLVDSREYVDMPTYKYAETDVFVIQNPGAYQYYIIRVYDDQFGNDENWLSPEWAELTLLMTDENAKKASGK